VDKNIQGALLAAQRLRRALLEAEVENRRPISSSDCPETETRGAPMPGRFSYRRRYHWESTSWRAQQRNLPG